MSKVNAHYERIDPRNGVRNPVAVVDPFRMHFDNAHYNRIDPRNGVSHSVSGVNPFIMRIYFAHVSGVSVLLPLPFPAPPLYPPPPPQCRLCRARPRGWLTSGCPLCPQAVGRHQCHVLLDQLKEEFLHNGGEARWLEGLQHVPKKLADLNEVNKLLAHRPWLLNKSHIEVSLRAGPGGGGRCLTLAASRPVYRRWLWSACGDPWRLPLLPGRSTSSARPHPTPPAGRPLRGPPQDWARLGDGGGLSPGPAVPPPRNSGGRRACYRAVEPEPVVPSAPQAVCYLIHRFVFGHSRSAGLCDGRAGCSAHSALCFHLRRLRPARRALLVLQPGAPPQGGTGGTRPPPPFLRVRGIIPPHFQENSGPNPLSFQFLVWVTL